MSSTTINLQGTDMTANERVFSEAESTVIADLVLWHRMPHLLACELLQLSAKRWSVWDPNNIQRISEARRQDQTRDWYFPISLSRWIWSLGQFTPPEACFTWAGMWHTTAHDVCPKPRPLPPMTCMLEEWQHASFPLCDIVASEGGLLLIKARQEVVPVSRSSRRKTAPSWPPSGDLGHSDDLRSSTASVPAGSSRPARGKSSGLPVDWIRLLVCNPLTRECKELPEAKCAEMRWKSWQHVYREGVQIHMDVHDEANCHQVVLILQNFVAVYKSTTGSWNCMRFQASRPWSVGQRTWTYHGATSRVAGRLYAADIQSAYRLGIAEGRALEQPIRVGTLRLFKVDTEAGRWMLVHEFSLSWFKLHPSDPNPDILYVPLRFLDQVKLVECMGSLYAVIPSSVIPACPQNLLTTGERKISSEDLPWNESEERKKRYKYLPMMFNLVKLEGDGEETALLRILDLSQVIESREHGREQDFGHFNRWVESFLRTDESASWGDNTFTCKVVGSVIWLLYQQECLLSYDVVSGKYTFRNMHEDRTHQSMNHTARCSDWSPFSYRPNFQLRP